MTGNNIVLFPENEQEKRQCEAHEVAFEAVAKALGLGATPAEARDVMDQALSRQNQK